MNIDHKNTLPVLIYCIIYNIIMLYFLYLANTCHGEECSLVYMLYLFYFWIIAAIVTITLLFLEVLKLRRAIDWLFLFLSTPILWILVYAFFQ